MLPDDYKEPFIVYESTKEMPAYNSGFSVERASKFYQGTDVKNVLFWGYTRPDDPRNRPFVYNVATGEVSDLPIK